MPTTTINIIDARIARMQKIVDDFSIENSLSRITTEDKPTSENKLQINIMEEHMAIKPKSDGTAKRAICIVAKKLII